MIQKFYVIGISIRTTNENGRASQDIPALWNRFMTEDIAKQIPNKTDSSVYCIYTDYEKDFTKPYNTILGCKVDNLDIIPKGMMGKIIEQGPYVKYTAKGNILEGSVYNEWQKIWNLDLERIYSADFELYDQRTLDTENAEVDIFIAIK